MKYDTHENPAWSVTFSPEDSVAEKLKKAAHVKPSPAQLAWMEKEYIAFLHYGPNTFNHVQWGNGQEKASDYHPEHLDVAQWCRVCSQAGMKMVLFTAKHHDGFCQWNTETTDFSIASSPAGKDVMEDLSRYCKENQIRLGVYLSPWDMHQRKEGLWPKPEYNDYFLSQLRELLSRYGTIDEVWFDGACSDFEIWNPVPTYTPKKWYEMIQQLQPGAVVRLYDPYEFASPEQWQRIQKGEEALPWSGIGVRWVGNEGGISRCDEWSVQPVFDRVIAENATWKDLGEEKYYQQAVGAIWYPLEVNTVLLNQWFWNEKTSSVRSLSDIIDVYYHSIGNNGVLLLNLSPDTQGIIRKDQEQRLMQLKEYVDSTFATNLAANARVTASTQTESHPAAAVLDSDKMTYWMPDGDWELEGSTATLTLELPQEATFDQVLVQEYIREGQRVAGWSFQVWQDGQWVELVHHKTIGYKTIRRFPQVTASKVRFCILRSWDTPLISALGLYLSAPLPQEEKESDMEITLSPEKIDPQDLRAGLRYSCYDAGLQSAALLDSVFAVKEVHNGIAEIPSHRYAGTDIGYSLTFEGYLWVPQSGQVRFKMENADGGLLYLGGSLILHNDEPHETKAVCRTIHLEQGYYPIKVLYTSFRHSGELRLEWDLSNHEFSEIGSEFFFCQNS